MAAGFAVGRFATPLAAAVVAFLMALPAASFEFLDGRVQIHGFAEMQIRAISSKYNEELDLRFADGVSLWGGFSKANGWDRSTACRTILEAGIQSGRHMIRILGMNLTTPAVIGDL